MATTIQQLNALVMNYDTALDHVQQSLQAALEAITDLQHIQQSETASSSGSTAAKKQQIMNAMQERVREISRASAKLQNEKGVIDRLKRGVEAGSVGVEDAVEVFGQSCSGDSSSSNATQVPADIRSLLKEFDGVFKSSQTSHDRMDVDGTADENADEEDDDEDIHVMQHTQTFLCPITQLRLDNPYTSTICKHSFSKDAIFDYLKQGAHKQCPVGGCRNILARDQLKPDKSLSRQLKRIDYDTAMSQFQ